MKKISKDDRIKKLIKENKRLKRKIKELETDKEEWMSGVKDMIESD